MKQHYEMVIGIEVHVELKTNTKIFCGCKTDFGAPPNTQCCPVCAGMPGALPVLNQQVVDYAVMAGLATNCSITPQSKIDRKNYYYPDSPKAYQISQFDIPICESGHMDIELAGEQKRIGITRIHIEEDAGKLVHDAADGTLIDLNRCGVPLIEIVSDPDIRSAEEAVAYLRKLRATILYTGVSDVKMNEGSFRADINLSIRPKGQKEYGTRTEMKNLNSFQFINRAIDYEYQRQVNALNAGEEIVQETRRFDSQTGKTYSMRTKEDADDYRYFPDPDLLPIAVSSDEVERLGKLIPALPDERKKEYMETYQLSSYHSEQLVIEKLVSDFFEEALPHTQHPQLLANLILSEVQRLIDPADEAIRIDAKTLAQIVDMLGSERINSSGGKKLVTHIWEKGGEPEALIAKLKLEQINDKSELNAVVNAVLEENPGVVDDYKSGKKQAIKALMGRAMGKTGGRGNPVLIDQILAEKLG